VPVPTAALPPASGVVELKPVILLKDVPVATPRLGVISVGLVANTRAPEPVSSVTAAARFAEEGVARNVATPVPRPVTPEVTGTVTVPLEPKDIAVPFTVTDEFASIVLVTVAVSPVVTTVPVTFGREIVRSAVGFTTVRVVSNSSAEDPSKTMLESDSANPETTGLVRVFPDIVRVLFVVATTAVSTFSVTVPLVPPPVSPVPAVTPSMSPAIFMLPPRLTCVPLIVIDEFVRDVFATFRMVLLVPLIVLLVNVSVTSLMSVPFLK